MTDKELESLKKKSLMVTDFSPNTKTAIVSSEINRITLNIKKKMSKNIEIRVFIVYK
jgi:hypothetical protein